MEPGRVVISKAGRDAGGEFVIISVESDQYVLIADGRLRKVSSPKKKKVIHLRAKVECEPALARGWADGKLLDADIRKYLERLAQDRKACKEEDAFG